MKTYTKRFAASFLFSVLCLAQSAQALEWKAFFVAGDHSIPNFDNGRQDLTRAFSQKAPLKSYQFSSSLEHISQAHKVYPATLEMLSAAFDQVQVNEQNEGCLVHMTSHGSKGQGFYLSRSGILSPQQLAKMVDKACGNVPTVILVSACYSGQFITEELQGPNRIILTAARADRPSFGCSTDTEYTYWDGCLLSELPRSQSWSELYGKVNACITEKESLIGVRPSEPQAYFGENTKEWKILE